VPDDSPRSPTRRIPYGDGRLATRRPPGGDHAGSSSAHACIPRSLRSRRRSRSPRAPRPSRVVAPSMTSGAADEAHRTRASVARMFVHRLSGRQVRPDSRRSTRRLTLALPSATTTRLTPRPSSPALSAGHPGRGARSGPTAQPPPYGTGDGDPAGCRFAGPGGPRASGLPADRVPGRR
jgi:hypothetical protein